MVPIYQMLKKYSESNPLPFHMPGHLLGRGLTDELKSAGALDITEIPGSDCLHHPEGAIRDAQEMAARCFGADYTIFLVNGSTAGIHAMIQSCVKPGGKLIIGRDCHVSALNALALINAEPVFVVPKVDEDNGISLGVKANDVEKALLSNPDAQGIFITRPNYYGVAQPLKEIAELASRYNVPLLVDEAHGAHFKFHEKFPATAMEAGADLCVQSLHKTLPALTQTALLHIKENGLISRKQAETTASMVQTTSPSYLLMASIDIVREKMEKSGKALYDELWHNLEYFNKELSKTYIKRVAYGCKDLDSDFSRIVLSFGHTSLNGFQAERLLRENFGIVAEMADMKNVVLIATPFHTLQDFDKLLCALNHISREYGGSGMKTSMPWPSVLPEKVLTIRDAMFSEWQEIPINESEGKISAASIIPYPPGIPLINPGERITAEYLDYINLLLSCSCPVHGANGRIRTVAAK